MAHNLTLNNGKYEFAYAGEAPWHALGQQLPGVATKDDILKAAGLEWVVQREKLYINNPGGAYEVPDFVANVRSDTREVLGVVSKDYRLIQNGDALAFVDSLAQSAGAKYHTAGSIRRGRQVFATAKLPASITVLPDDVVDQYLLLVNAHDGSLGFHLRWTTVRVVCNNTLTAALAGGASYQYTVRHVGDLDAQLREAAKALGVANRYFEVAGEAYRALAAKDLTSTEFMHFLTEFLPVSIPASAEFSQAQAEDRDRVVLARSRISELYEGGLGTDLPGVRGTAWGAYNAATEWIDRVRTARQDGTLRSNAAEAAVLGVGQDLRNRAMASALALVS